MLCGNTLSVLDNDNICRGDCNVMILDSLFSSQCPPASPMPSVSTVSVPSSPMGSTVSDISITSPGPSFSSSSDCGDIGHDATPPPPKKFKSDFVFVGKCPSLMCAGRFRFSSYKVQTSWPDMGHTSAISGSSTVNQKRSMG